MKIYIFTLKNGLFSRASSVDNTLLVDPATLPAVPMLSHRIPLGTRLFHI